MNISGKKLILFFSTFILMSGVFLFIPIVFSISELLSKTRRVDANLLLVEGWLQPYAIKMAYSEYNINKYDRVITTGLKPPEYFNVSSNGVLIFYLNSLITASDNSDNHIFEVNAYSELGGEHSAHFNFFINNRLISDVFADRTKRKYQFRWKGKLEDVDSVMVQFDNDGFGDFGDRNLFVKEVIIDHKMPVTYQNHSVYEIKLQNRISRIINNFESYADIARNEFLALGIDSSIVIAVPGDKAKINKTLTSALAFRKWLETSQLNIKGINIVSVGNHSQRTWMTYCKVLGKSYKIGIISLPDDKVRYSRKHQLYKTLREILGIIYYWVILLPY